MKNNNETNSKYLVAVILNYMNRYEVSRYEPELNKLLKQIVLYLTKLDDKEFDKKRLEL